MKTRKLLISALCLMFISFNAYSHGGNADAVKQSAFSIEKQISARMQYPEFAQHLMGSRSVYVKFHINNDFSVKVENAHANDLRLQYYVVKELEKQSLLTDRENIGKSFAIKMDFE